RVRATIIRKRHKKNIFDFCYHKLFISRFQEDLCMLDFMRRQSSKLKWVWVLLIFIFSVTLVTLYIPIGDLGSVAIINDVAVIGSERVSAKEFQTAYRNYIDQMRSQLSPEMLKAFRFDRQILNSLINH